MMLDAIIIGSNPDLTAELLESCNSLEELSVRRTFDDYPGRLELVQALNLVQPPVVFLEVDPLGPAMQTVMSLRASHPNTSVVGFSQQGALSVRERQALALNEILMAPFESQRVLQAILRAIRGQGAERVGKILAVLPAKAGSGASTTALNLAAALARECQQKVLLLDADLHSGILSVLLRIDAKQSIIDALLRAAYLNDSLWATLTVHVQGFELLGMPRAREAQMFSPWDYQQLLSFARTRYQYLVVDLPEVINEATGVVVKEANQVFVVCTTEMPSLILARRRIFELEVRGVDPKSVGIVLNRSRNRNADIRKAERSLGRRISTVIPNTYKTIEKCIQQGKPVSGASSIALAFQNFAAEVTGATPSAQPAKRWLARWRRRRTS